MEEGSRDKGRGDALREEIHTISGFQDGEKEARAKECGKPLEEVKARKWITSLEPPERISALPTS